MDFNLSFQFFDLRDGCRCTFALHSDPGRFCGKLHGLLHRAAIAKTCQKIAAVGITGGGGIHGLHLFTGNKQPLFCIQIVTARAPGCQKQTGLRIFLMKQTQNRIRFKSLGSGKGSSFHFIDAEHIHQFHRVAPDAVIVGCGIEENGKTLLLRSLHQVRQVGDLILQHQPVAGRKGFQCPVDLLFGDLPIGTAVDQDAVFAAADLNDGMTGGRSIVFYQIIGICCR